MKINADRVEQLQRADETRSTHQAEASGVQAWVDQSPKMTAQRALISGFTPASSPVQRMLSNHQPPESNLATDRLNIVGEEHPESDPRRQAERTHCSTVLGPGKYWVEQYFPIEAGNREQLLGDPPFLRFYNYIAGLHFFDHIDQSYATDFHKIYANALSNVHILASAERELLCADSFVDLYADFERRPGDHLVSNEKLKDLKLSLDVDAAMIRFLTYEMLTGHISMERHDEIINNLNVIFARFRKTVTKINKRSDVREVPVNQKFVAIAWLRSLAMAEAAMLPGAPKSGVWKVGQNHVNHMAELPVRTFKLISRNDYNLELAAFKAYWNHPTPNTDESANPPGSE